MRHRQQFSAVALLCALAGCASTGQQGFRTVSESPEAGDAQRIDSAGERGGSDLAATGKREESVVDVQFTRAVAPAAPLRHAVRQSSLASAAAENVAPLERPQRAEYAPTLAELLEYALANNPDVQAAHMKAHALSQRVPQACSLDDPMLMVSAFLEPIQTAAGP